MDPSIGVVKNSCGRFAYELGYKTSLPGSSMARFARRLSLMAALATLPALASAQDNGNGFLFGAPAGAFTLRGGWAMPRAKSDLFTFTTQNLTLNRSDFSSPDL